MFRRDHGGLAVGDFADQFVGGNRHYREGEKRRLVALGAPRSRQQSYYDSDPKLRGIF